MNMMDKIFEQAEADPKVVAFPEVGEEKILKAALECAAKGYCRPLLVAKKSDIAANAEKYGLDLTGLDVFECEDEAAVAQLAEDYFAKTGMNSVKSMKRKSKDSMYVALMLQEMGKADVMFAGMSHTTGDVIWAGQMVIGLKEGVTTASSIGICDIPGYEGSEGNLLAIGDSAVCANPDSEDLASIAISACDTVREILGWDPRCALLSFSTDGSAENELVDKVRRAVEIAHERRPEYKIDGEFQFDAATVPAIAAKKVKRESAVAGKANVVIWPDLNAGNIGVKLIQQFGHANAYGPVLQGFRKIVCDCSRSAPVSEVVGNVAIAVVRAQKGE